METNFAKKEHFPNGAEILRTNFEFNSLLLGCQLIRDELTDTVKRQEDTAKKYKALFEEFTKKRAQEDIEIQDLVSNVKETLGYCRTAGLSSAFSEKHKAANNFHSKGWWLIGAGLSILSTAALGVWIITGWGINRDEHCFISNLVGRLSMMPITFTVAIFCANQYVKQKNIIEDYDYKKVLAQSMSAFSDELRDKDMGTYKKYAFILVKEILQDPLRKRDKDGNNVLELVTNNILGAILKMVKGSGT